MIGRRTLRPILNYRRCLRAALWGVAAAIPVATLTLWALSQHKPGWYEPVTLDEKGVRRTSTAAISWFDDVSDKIVQRRPFDLVISGHLATEFATVLPQLFPEQFANWPSGVTAPAVTFEEGVIRIGLHCEIDGWRWITVVNIEAKLTPGARALDLRLAGVSGGSLPLPRALLQNLLDRALGPETGWSRALLDLDSVHVLNPVRGMDDLFKGIRVRNRFVWPNGKRPFRVTGIDAKDGRIRIGIRPI